MDQWEYAVVPWTKWADSVRRHDLRPERPNELGSQGWEAVGLSLKKGDLVAWLVVLLKRSVA